MRRAAPVFATILSLLLGAPVGAAQTLRSAIGSRIVIAPDPLAAARDTLAITLSDSMNAQRLSSPPPGWTAAVRAVERRIGAAWNGLPPVLIQVPDDGSGFVCEGGDVTRARCLGRTEMVRDGNRSAFVLLFASSAMLDRHVWEHELTHALLAQMGRDRESRAHDRRYFRE